MNLVPRSTPAVLVAAGITENISADCSAGKVLLGTVSYWLNTLEVGQVYTNGAVPTGANALGKNATAASDKLYLEIFCAAMAP